MSNKRLLFTCFDVSLNNTSYFIDVHIILNYFHSFSGKQRQR